MKHFRNLPENTVIQGDLILDPLKIGKNMTECYVCTNTKSNNKHTRNNDEIYRLVVVDYISNKFLRKYNKGDTITVCSGFGDLSNSAILVNDVACTK